MRLREDTRKLLYDNMLIIQHNSLDQSASGQKWRPLKYTILNANAKLLQCVCKLQSPCALIRSYETL